MSLIKKITVSGTNYDIGADYGNISNTPSIPSKTSDITNDSGFITNSVSNLTNYYDKTTSDGKYATISSLNDEITNRENADNLKQNINDNTLTTTNKTIPTAINEVNSIAKGANQATSYSNYSTMVSTINSLASTYFNTGQNIYIVTTEVPDLWVSSVESTSSTYTYTTDSALVSDLQTNGYIQCGYYKLSMLETQKVDLTNYVEFTDYASQSTVGVIGVESGYGSEVNSSGKLRGSERTYAQYSSSDARLIISKGTLENLKSTSISSSSTDIGYATPKSVYDYISSLDATDISY